MINLIKRIPFKKKKLYVFPPSQMMSLPKQHETLVHVLVKLWAIVTMSRTFELQCQLLCRFHSVLSANEPNYHKQGLISKSTSQKIKN